MNILVAGANVGNNSFYVMALHFVGFKLCT